MQPDPRVYYFGCWNSPGHYLHAPGGAWPKDGRWREYYAGLDGQPVHIDGTLAPRKMGRDRRYAPDWLPPGSLCWQGQGKNNADRQSLVYCSEELPQGQYLVHHLDNGFTAMAWWDRCQGDTRGACNSVVLLEGRHDAAAMLAALQEHFPHVLANLRRHGVEPVEVKR